MLPAEIRAAAADALGAGTLEEEFAWMSWAGTVWRLSTQDQAVFAKRAAHLEGERDRLEWLRGRWPVPEVLGFFYAVGDDWLLTRAVPGVPMYHPSVGWPPTQVARTLGDILRKLHSVDARGCPFGTKKPGNVLIHGDYCLPNVLVEDGQLSAVIDVGGAGLGNPEQDLAAGVWTLQYNFGKGFAGDFLDAYGWPPMTDQAIERLRRKYGR